MLMRFSLNTYCCGKGIVVLTEERQNVRGSLFLGDLRDIVSVFIQRCEEIQGRRCS